jgi:hypothetical protein
MTASAQRGSSSGWILVAGSVISIVGNLPELVNSDLGTPAALVQLGSLIVGALLILAGMPAMHRLQAKKVGKVGLGAFIGVFVAMLLANVVENIIFLLAELGGGDNPGQPSPVFLSAALLSGALMLICGIIYGIVTLRAHVYSAVAGWLLVLGAVLSLALFVGPDTINKIIGTLSLICFFLAFVVMGVRLSSSAITADASVAA